MCYQSDLVFCVKLLLFLLSHKDTNVEDGTNTSVSRSPRFGELPFSVPSTSTINIRDDKPSQDKPSDRSEDSPSGKPSATASRVIIEESCPDEDQVEAGPSGLSKSISSMVS